MKVFNVCKVAQRIWLPRKNQDRVSLQGGSAPRVTAIISLLSIPNEPVKVQISQDILLYLGVEGKNHPQT